MTCNTKDVDSIPKISFDNSECNTSTLKDEFSKIESLPYLPELSGSKEYWEIVRNHNNLYCLDQLTNDTTETDIHIPNAGGNYLIADISISIISDIILCFPLDSILDANFENYKSTEINPNIFLHEDYGRYEIVSKEINRWISTNKDQLIWIKDTNNYRTSGIWAYNHSQHPAGGYFKPIKNMNCEFVK